MKLGLVILPAIIAALAGCQTGQVSVNKNPKAAFDRCFSGMAKTNITAKHEIASFMGVSLDRMPTVFCQRIVDGLRSGRITLSDINNLQLNQPTDVFRVLKGK